MKLQLLTVILLEHVTHNSNNMIRVLPSNLEGMGANGRYKRSVVGLGLPLLI